MLTGEIQHNYQPLKKIYVDKPDDSVQTHQALIVLAKYRFRVAIPIDQSQIPKPDVLSKLIYLNSATSKMLT